MERDLLDSDKAAGMMEELQKLLEESVSTHSQNYIRSGPRDLSLFVELENYPDDYRWLIASEGRSQVMRWLILDPL